MLNKFLKIVCATSLMFVTCVISTEDSNSELWFPYPNDPGKCYREISVFSIWKDGDKPTEGNGSDPNLVVIDKCCEGYQEYKYNKSKCIAVCGNKCKNGFCVAPDVCECFPNFVKSLTGECVNACPFGCLNGRCHWSGECDCNPGYVYTNLEKQVCAPLCSKGCGWNENCTAPNTCDCIKGYARDAQTKRCEPICNPSCGSGGRCLSPGKCFCNPGYVIKNGTCQAYCARDCGKHGTCVKPNVCQCDSSHVWIDVHGMCVQNLFMVTQRPPVGSIASNSTVVHSAHLPTGSHNPDHITQHTQYPSLNRQPIPPGTSHQSGSPILGHGTQLGQYPSLDRQQISSATSHQSGSPVSGHGTQQGHYPSVNRQQMPSVSPPYQQRLPSYNDRNPYSRGQYNPQHTSQNIQHSPLDNSRTHPNFHIDPMPAPPLSPPYIPQQSSQKYLQYRGNYNQNMGYTSTTLEPGTQGT